MLDLEEILATTCSIGWGAADLLRSYCKTGSNQNLNVHYKYNEPVTAADLAVNHYILKRLQAELNNLNFGYISEETYKRGNREKLTSEFVWIIDPIDGTRDFIKKTGEYAIQIAVVRKKRPILAVVVIPELQKLYYAVKGNGTFVKTPDGKSQPIKVSTRKSLEEVTLVFSRSHRNPKLEYLLQNLPCKNHKSLGSVGFKVATIVEQGADIYISPCGKSAPKDWDMAAPELILTEAGGKFTHFSGDEFQYNTGYIDQWGGLLASNGQLHELLSRKVEAILETYQDLE